MVLADQAGRCPGIVTEQSNALALKSSAMNCIDICNVSALTPLETGSRQKKSPFITPPVLGLLYKRGMAVNQLFTGTSHEQMSNLKATAKTIEIAVFKNLLMTLFGS